SQTVGELVTGRHQEQGDPCQGKRFPPDRPRNIADQFGPVGPGYHQSRQNASKRKEEERPSPEDPYLRHQPVEESVRVKYPATPVQQARARPCRGGRRGASAGTTRPAGRRPQPLSRLKKTLVPGQVQKLVQVLRGQRLAEAALEVRTNPT